MHMMRKLSGLKACSKLEIEIKRKSVIIVKVGILVFFFFRP